jgi:hypothetical protein
MFIVNKYIINVVYKEKRLVFNVEDLFTRRRGLDLEGDYNIINEYIEQNVNKEQLFDLYNEINYDINIMNFKVAVSKINKLIDLYNPTEVENFFKIKIPKVDLNKEFTNVNESHLLTKDKTYLVHQFYELMVFIFLLKTIIPFFSLLITNKYRDDQHITTQVLNIINETKLKNFPAYDRLVRYITGHLLNLLKLDFIDSNNSKITMVCLRYSITTEEIEDFLLGVLVFKILLSARLLGGKKVISDLYSELSKIVNNKDTIKNTYFVKKTSYDEDDERESVLESYRQTTAIPIGYVSEFQWVYDNIDKFFNVFGLNKEDIELFVNVRKEFIYYYIENGILPLLGSLYITKYVTHKIIDSRSIDYIDKEQYVNAAALAYVVLLKNGHTQMAYLIATAPALNIYGHLSKENKLRKEVRDDLERVYPISRITKGGGRELLILDTIDLLISELNRPSVYIFNGIHGMVNVELPEDIKNIIAKFFIFIGEI